MCAPVNDLHTHEKKKEEKIDAGARVLNNNTALVACWIDESIRFLFRAPNKLCIFLLFLFFLPTLVNRAGLLFLGPCRESRDPSTMMTAARRRVIRLNPLDSRPGAMMDDARHQSVEACTPKHARP